MRRYGGTLIHRSRDEHGLIEVVEDDFSRSLHFGTEPKQSSMDLGDPIRLLLSYTRAMLVTLLFSSERPERVLLIGLGGGSLAKFLLYYFPDCRVDAVEFRSGVVEVAHGYFGLPRDERFHVVVEDGGYFVRTADRGRFGEYDLILVDAYEALGMSRSVNSLSFFAACQTRLSSQGAFGINLWSGDCYRLEETLADIRKCFGSVFRLPVEGKENVIALAPSQPLRPRLLKQWPDRAGILDQRLDIEFSAFLRTLRKTNNLPA